MLPKRVGRICTGKWTGEFYCKGIVKEETDHCHGYEEEAAT